MQNKAEAQPARLQLAAGAAAGAQLSLAKIQIFSMIQMFSNFSYSSTNLDFVHLCLPLLN